MWYPGVNLPQTAQTFLNMNPYYQLLKGGVLAPQVAWKIGGSIGNMLKNILPGIGGGAGGGAAPSGGGVAPSGGAAPDPNDPTQMTSLGPGVHVFGTPPSEGYHFGNVPGSASVNTFMGGVMGQGGSYWHGTGRGAPPVLGGGNYGYYGLGGGGPTDVSRFNVGLHHMKQILKGNVPGGANWKPWIAKYEAGEWDPFKYPHGGTAEANAAWLAAHPGEREGIPAIGGSRHQSRPRSVQ